MHVTATSTLSIQGYQRPQQVSLQSRSGTASTSSDLASASSQRSGVRAQDSQMDQKLASLSRFGTAVSMAIQMGKDVEPLLSRIE